MAKMILATDGDAPITAKGFLPKDILLIAPPRYSAWDDIARDLPSLIPCRIRTSVNQLPLLSTDRLESQDELRWAYVRLTFISQAYIRGGKTSDDVCEILPPQLAVPLIHVSNRLGLPPVITYASTCLWNFRSESDDFSNPEDLGTIITFTGTESESWFYRISIAIEARGAAVVPVLVNALQAGRSCDYEPLARVLRQLECCIRDIIKLLRRMSEKCDAAMFYHRIRPFLAGSKNAAELPNGVFYDQGAREGEWKQLRGGSNGQSTLIQLFDKALGIDHGSKVFGMTSFHDEMKQYMPAAHRRFLEQIERQASIREVVASLSSFHDARAAYDAAVGAMSDLRSQHLSVVARYITIPSVRSPSERNTTGTGGTLIHPFLRQARDDTKAAKIKPFPLGLQE